MHMAHKPEVMPQQSSASGHCQRVSQRLTILIRCAVVMLAGAEHDVYFCNLVYAFYME